MRKSRPIVILSWLAPVVAVGGALVTSRLFDIPFGSTFDASLYVTIAALILTFFLLGIRLISSEIRWHRTPGTVLVVLSLLILVFTITVSIDYKILPQLSKPDNVTSEQWIEDLRFLVKEMEEKHPRLFEMVPADTFCSHVERLEKRIPDLNDNQIEAEFAKLMALPQDAHSYPNIFSLKLDWHIFPLSIWYFDEGLYVLDAGREYRRAIGARLVRVEDTSVEDLYRIMRPYMAAESEFGWKDRFCQIALVSEWLEAAGVIEDRGRARFAFESDSGEPFEMEMRSFHYLPVLYWSMMKPADNRASYIDNNDRKDNYWFEYIEESATLYFQFNRVIDQPDGESLEEFTARLSDFLDVHEIDRFIIDLRKNDGGGGPSIADLVDFLAGNEKINRHGGFFAITSRKTFSAAVMFLSMLENNTKVLLVGEPTGQGPFFCGVPRPVILPNSEREFVISRQYNEASPFKPAGDCIRPDIYVNYTWDDYISGRDPAMEAILEYPAVYATPSLLLEQEQLDRYTGRYLYSPSQILTVENKGGRLAFHLSDYFEDSHLTAGSDMYPASQIRFLTDIGGVEILFPPGTGNPAGYCIVSYRDSERVAERTADGFMLPMELFVAGRIDEGVEAFITHKEAYLEQVPHLENVLNRMGYSLLGENKHSEAIDVFALNVELFPGSSNVYDSLGEAYMEKGERELAIENYERSLELNPDNANAIEKLKELRSGGR